MGLFELGEYQATRKRRRNSESRGAHLEMRLTAPPAVRGGKNSRENQRSPDSMRRLILSLSLCPRSASPTGVEHLELSFELSPLLLAPLESFLHGCQPFSSRWFTMITNETTT